MGAENPITADEQGKRDSLKKLAWRHDLRGAGRKRLFPGEEQSTAPKHGDRVYLESFAMLVLEPLGI